MALPAFTHIHCSSRYDRSAASLERDLDDWMAHSSLVTLTEVTNDRRAGTMREKGWDYYNAASGGDKDNCGICWSKDVWRRKSGDVKRLSTNTFDRVSGQHNLYIWAATVVLVHRVSGHKLMVSVVHFPAHVEGPAGFKTTGAGWAARKRAYLTALTNWSAYVRNQVRKQHLDGVLLVADWNVNLKDRWFRNILKDHWGKGYLIAWQKYPTTGGALAGGPYAPLGSPGVSKGDRIIDGSMYMGLKMEEHPHLMARVQSSDHRPYKERFRFKAVAEKDDDDEASGDAKPGEMWWGFGDYMTDELYALNLETGSAGGEVL